MSHLTKVWTRRSTLLAKYNPYYEIIGDEAPVTGIIRVHGVVTYCKVIILLKRVFSNCIVQRFSSVTSIERSAFNICSSLTSIHCKRSTPPSISSVVFDNVCEAGAGLPDAAGWLWHCHPPTSGSPAPECLPFRLLGGQILRTNGANGPTTVAVVVGREVIAGIE
jgi:hypothetical protein